MKPNSEKAPFRPLRLLGIALLTLFGGFVALILLAGYPGGLLAVIGQFFRLVLFGWISYLGEVLPRVTFNPEIALGAVIALALATWGLHAILRWLAGRLHGESAPWRPGWSAKITAMVLLLFATSIAATGIVHQAGWLFTIKNWTYMSGMGRQTQELGNVKQVMPALRMYADANGDRLPRDLDDLFPRIVDTHRIFYSAATQGEPPERMLYFPDNHAETEEQTIIVTGPHPRDGWRVVGYRDGSVRIKKEEEVQQELQRQRKRAE